MPAKADCLFCEEGTPCVTHADKPTQRRPRKPSGSKLTESPTPTLIPVTSSPTEDAWMPALSTPTPRFEVVIHHESDDDLELREVLRNLWSILSPQTQKIYQDIAYPPKNASTVQRRTEVRRTLHATRRTS